MGRLKVGQGHRTRPGIMKALESTTASTIMPNTYSRRMSRFSAYDADAVTVRSNVVDLDKERTQQIDDKENRLLENMLTKVHEVSPMFVLVNADEEGFPIVYVSDEFLDFWKFSRKKIFLKDGRLSMLVGKSTNPELGANLEVVLRGESEVHSSEYTLYKEGKKKAVPVYVTAVDLPKQSNANYVLIGIEEVDDSSTFGVDFDSKNKGLFHRFCRVFKSGDEKSKYDANGDYIPEMFRRKFEIMESFRKEKGNGWVVIHDNTIKILWDWLILYTVLWTVFIVPMQLSFRVPCTSPMGKVMADCSVMDAERMAKSTLFELDWLVTLICEIIFIIDVCISFLTTFISGDGLVISELNHIVSHYGTHWFTVDVLGAIPWEIIIAAFQVTDDHVIHFLKIIALLRVFRIARNSNSYMTSGVSSLLFMMAVFTIFAHFIGCGWFTLGESTIAVQDGWLYKFVAESPFTKYSVKKFDYDDGLTQEELYLTCLYFSFTSLSTVGFGNAAPQLHKERIFSVAVMVLGSLIFATVFGYVANIIHRISRGASELNSRKTELTDFISVHKFPESLAHRMEDFFNNHWFTTYGVVADEIMDGWPRALREDCYLHMHDMLLRRWPVLREASSGCQRMLSERLKRVNMSPGDYIYHAGDCVGEISFVIRGHVKVTNRNRLIGILTSGDVLGEIFWPTRIGKKSRASVQAITYCEFEVLNHEDLNEILIQFPDYWDVWVEKLKISYEISSKQDLFNQFVPNELVTFVENQRTIARDSLLDKIREESDVKNPKEFYYKLSKKREQKKRGKGMDVEMRKALMETNRKVRSQLEKMDK